MQYMTLYQLVLAVTYNVAFFMDGSTLSMRQVSPVAYAAVAHLCVCMHHASLKLDAVTVNTWVYLGAALLYWLLFAYMNSCFT